MSRKNYKIPFDKDGNMLSYPYNVEEWREPYKFSTRLKYNGYSRGRSSAVILFKDWQGRSYSMFMSDFDKMMQDGFDVDGKSVSGIFTFVKKGQNYGLQYLGR